MIVIGDIHGCSKSLEKLLSQLPAGREIYSTGDLIDRGPDSKGVVSLCMERGIRPVMGNHEHMLLDYLDETGKYGRGIYFINGGLKTLKSYDDNIMPEHLEYIRSMPLYIETDHFILSHAGVSIMKSLEEACDLAKDIDLNILWNRGRLSDIGKPQVVGHTPQFDVSRIKAEEKVVVYNIDTGCVYPSLGRLTAMSFPELEIFQVGCVE